MNLFELNFDTLDTFLLNQKKIIIHQVWFTNIIPSKKKTRQLYQQLKTCRDSWDIHNPDFIHIIWNQQKATELIREYFTEYHDLYKNYKYEIQRCDMIRYCILYRYGGLYVDMDYKCKKPFDGVMKKWNTHDIYFVETPNLSMISNSLIISHSKEHIFWKTLLIEMYKNQENFKNTGRHISIMYTTGPGILTKLFNIYKYRYKINTLPIELFNPSGLLKETFDSEQVYSIHYGMGSWEKKDSKTLVELYKNYKILLFIIFIMSISLWLPKCL